MPSAAYRSSAPGGSAKGPSSRLTVALPSQPEMSTLKFGRSIYHPKCPGDLFSWYTLLMTITQHPSFSGKDLALVTL